MNEYRLETAWGRSTALTYKELVQTIRELSFCQSDMVGTVMEREHDGTLGRPWGPCTLDFSIKVGPGHFGPQSLCSSIYVLDGKVICGYLKAKEFLTTQGIDPMDILPNL